MNMIEATGLIRIIMIPAGEAPLVIRMAWFGLTLPCYPYLGYSDKGLDRGVVTGTEVGPNRYGFSVPQDLAIEILDRLQLEAVNWWKQHGYPKPGECFCFAESEAEIVSGVTRQRIVEVTEEMQGRAER